MQAAVATPGQDVPAVVSRPVPIPEPGEVLVRVRAAAVNNADLASPVDGRVAGYEFSGTVVAVGQGVAADVVGTSVMGTSPGAFAELVVAHHRHVVPIPAGLAFEAATALPTALLTEYGALRRAPIQEGDVVLITAGTSGIGLVGIQVAHVLGAARVIATTRNPQRRALLARAGADHIIVTGDTDLSEAVRSATGGRGADVVLEHVGGGVLGQAIEATREGGSVVSVGRLAGPSAQVDLYALARQAVTLRSVSFGFTPPSVIGDLLDGVAADLGPAIAEGRIAAVVDRVHQFEDIAAVLAGLRAGDNTEGKVVVTFGGAP